MTAALGGLVVLCPTTAVYGAVCLVVAGVQAARGRRAGVWLVRCGLLWLTSAASCVALDLLGRMLP